MISIINKYFTKKIATSFLKNKEIFFISEAHPHEGEDQDDS